MDERKYTKAEAREITVELVSEALAALTDVMQHCAALFGEVEAKAIFEEAKEKAERIYVNASIRN